MSHEQQDRRFGIIAVEKNFITKEQLFIALQVQAEENLNGKEHRLIGVILYDKGYLTQQQIRQILAEGSQ